MSQLSCNHVLKKTRETTSKGQMLSTTLGSSLIWHFRTALS